MGMPTATIQMKGPDGITRIGVGVGAGMNIVLCLNKHMFSQSLPATDPLPLSISRSGGRCLQGSGLTGARRRGTDRLQVRRGRRGGGGAGPADKLQGGGICEGF